MRAVRMVARPALGLSRLRLKYLGPKALAETELLILSLHRKPKPHSPRPPRILKPGAAWTLNPNPPNPTGVTPSCTPKAEILHLPHATLKPQSG